MKLQYRPDIDGLRAVAVIAVMAFHAFPEIVPGGFVGVDIFFVISGFLITSLLLKDLGAGTYSIASFYRRRVLRIFPAMIVVLATVLFSGAILFFPDELRNLAKHIVGSLVFSENIILWREAGYFDDAAIFKPLLHFWSLAVEEQYYIVWPILLAWFYKRGRVGVLIVGFAAISFAVNLVQIRFDHVGAFFLPFSRFWELMAGSALAYHIQRGRFEIKRPHANLFAAFGLLLIVTGIAECRERGYPGLLALFPVVGTFLVIAAGPTSYVNRFLASKALVAIGLISYPLYLWHWPLLSFSRIIEPNEPKADVRVLLLVVSVLLSWLTYRFVETPIRFGHYFKKPVTILIASLIPIACFALVIVANRTGIRSERLVDSTCPADLAKAKIPFCAKSNSEPKIALIGDSHAEHLFSSLSGRDSEGWLLVANRSCPPARGIDITGVQDGCRERNEAIYKFIIGSGKIETVVFSFFSGWSLATNFAANHKFNRSGPEATRLNGESDADKKSEILRLGLLRGIRDLKAAGKQLVFVLDVPELPFLPRECLQRAFASAPRQPDCRVERKRIDERQASIRKILANLKTEIPELRIVDPIDEFCDSDYCYGRKDGKLLYQDSHHLNSDGSDLVTNVYFRN